MTIYFEEAFCPSVFWCVCIHSDVTCALRQGRISYNCPARIAACVLHTCMAVFHVYVYVYVMHGQIARSTIFRRGHCFLCSFSETKPVYFNFLPSRSLHCFSLFSTHYFKHAPTASFFCWLQASFGYSRWRKDQIAVIIILIGDYSCDSLRARSRSSCSCCRRAFSASSSCNIQTTNGRLQPDESHEHIVEACRHAQIQPRQTQQCWSRYASKEV